MVSVPLYSTHHLRFCKPQGEGLNPQLASLMKTSLMEKTLPGRLVVKARALALVTHRTGTGLTREMTLYICASLYVQRQRRYKDSRFLVNKEQNIVIGICI